VKRFDYHQLAEASFSSIAYSSDGQTFVRRAATPFSVEVRRNASVWGTSKVCLYFSGCWRSNVSGYSQSSFYT